MRPLLLFFLLSVSGFGETGADAWLRYEPTQASFTLPATIVTLGQSEVLSSAQNEIIGGLQQMFGRTLRVSPSPVDEDMLVLGTIDAIRERFSGLILPSSLITDGYCIKSVAANHHKLLLITAVNDRGVLYGAFSLLRHVVLHQQVAEESNPRQAVRWVNEWDNLDGSIERGYGGRSIFFAGNNVVPDLMRAAQYARLLASLGINSCTVNNVNANPRVLSDEFLPQLARIAAAFRPWGVQLSISVPFNSPKTVGGLGTFDPLDPSVQAWWRSETDKIYQTIPDLAGFVVKADSEGQLGPSTYGRTHADAANVLAAALKPHRGILIYRAFVYNHHLDWRNLKNDRAKAAYENFRPLDGHFASNVLLQIKCGPIDFQAREPFSPLFFALPHTGKAMELQITQEYTGQQRHLCYLVPMWKQMLEIAPELSGMVGVSNVGLDANWMGADLAQANLYGFGRLAWNRNLSVEQITSEWTHMTWGDNPLVDQTIMQLELVSWHTYESYTGPLGLGTLTDILHGHYGPGIETAERNGWGQWIRADHAGIGMDRTVATGTGYIGQYPPVLAAQYETLARCPDDLLLFMHHVPYTYMLHSGKTVIQEVYDSHYAGAAEAQAFPREWKALRGHLDEQRYQAVLGKLEYQAGHAMVWRDAICNWFFRESGIPDARGRVGHYPDRTEAEGMHLIGYDVIAVTPWEDASGGHAISCPKTETQCSAAMSFSGAPGWYDVNVQYFDTAPGPAAFTLFLNNQAIKAWRANANLPGTQPNGDTSTREYVSGVPLRRGDQLRLVGSPAAGDAAAVDYIEIVPRKPRGRLQKAEGNLVQSPKRQLGQ